jgi:hypothetical protein
LIKNYHFLTILGPKHDFLKRPLKRRILTLFLGIFWPEIRTEIFKTKYSRKEVTFPKELLYWFKKNKRSCIRGFM